MAFSLKSLGGIGGVAGGLTSGLGSVLGAFGSSSPEQLNYNKALKGLTDKSVKWLEGDNPSYETALADYTQANRDRIANTRRLAGLAESDFGGFLNQTRGYDPYAGISSALNPQVAALKDVMGYATDAGRREDSLALAALGRGGRPSGGSYEKALVADRTARQFAPQFGNIISNLGGIYGTAEGSRLGNLAAAVDLINRRTGTADYGADLELNPALARQALRQGQFQNWQGLTDVERANTAGWEESGDFATRLGRGLEDAGGALMQGSAAMGGGRSYGGGGYGYNPIVQGEIGGIPWQLGGGWGGRYGGGFNVNPSNWWTLSPAERANYNAYRAMVAQNTPYNFVGE